jgi:hypothetical protein
VAETTQTSKPGIDPLAAVSAGVSALTGIATTIAGINDMKKRRDYEFAMGLLSNAQQKELNEQLLKANTQNERLQILSSAILQYTISAQSSADKTNQVMLIIAAAIGVTLIIGGIVYAVVKRKK